MSQLKNQTGLSLIEVLVAIGIAAISVGAFTQFAIMTEKSRSDVDRQRMVKETLLNNLIEIKGLPITSLPPVGNCRIRKYNPLGDFDSEAVVADISDLCGVTVTRGHYYVLTRVQNSSSIAATFSLPASMKLPQYSNLIYQVSLKSIWKGPDDQNFKEEVSIFKR